MRASCRSVSSRAETSLARMARAASSAEAKSRSRADALPPPAEAAVRFQAPASRVEPTSDAPLERKDRLLERGLVQGLEWALERGFERFISLSLERHLRSAPRRSQPGAETARRAVSTASLPSRQPPP